LLPNIVRDLACAAKNGSFVFLSIADRLKRVLTALDSGQQLPSHECILSEAPDAWPATWQNVLSKLTIAAAEKIPPAARMGSALHTAQTVLRGGDLKRIELDSSFRHVQTLSQTAAVEFVAAVLANTPAELSRTVIVCEDDSLALRLDACLNRIGLPTMGASAFSKAHPVLQILPLSLTLCKEPVNPQSLLDFLSLPVSPIPRLAASVLARSLAEEPGLGSGKWQEAMEDLCSAENDPEGKLRERLDCWLFCKRVPAGAEIPKELIRSRCGLVAQWASGRALAMAKEEPPNLPLIQALQIAAGQASLLGKLAECQRSDVSAPQLARLLEEALANGVEITGFVEAESGPVRVRSLAEIDRPCHRLIWLGLGTGDAAACRWSADQFQALLAAGVDLDDGSKALSALRSVEASGLCHVQDAVLTVLLHQDIESRWHPIWLAIRELLSDKEKQNPLVLENLINADDIARLSPFTCNIQVTNIEPPQPQRPLWDIPQELIHDRETVSASELQDRLACPLKWVLNYQARLRSSPIARLPDDFQLKGTFCHSVFERVFKSGGDLPSVENAVAQVLDVFDQRLSLDAAPLAQPDKYMERQKLRKEMANATSVLIKTLASGGYRIKGIEVALSGEAFGKALTGSIDCLAEQKNGMEAVIDFKYGGRSKYQDLIKNGKAVQLATYAYGRSSPANTFPAVAYLVLSDGLLFTPSGSPIDGDSNRFVVDGISIQDVWEQFAAAIHNGDVWLTGDDQVPARPLLEAEHWPGGAELVLETNLKPDAVQAVCKYCDYQHICGLKELQ
jgi:ATP-dependent helicase/nuclease subunit B